MIYHGTERYCYTKRKYDFRAMLLVTHPHILVLYFTANLPVH